MNRRGVTQIVCFCLLFLQGVVGMNIVQAERCGRGRSQLPIYGLIVTIEKNRMEELFTQIRMFADKQAFAIRIAPTTPSHQDYLIQLWREDIKIIGTNSVEPNVFGINFYENDDEPVLPDVLKALSGDLKELIGQIKNVSVVEDK
jgi:hypothetical protein